MNRPATADRQDPSETRERALAALKQVVSHKPIAEINYGDIAAEAGLPWQTVKRMLGPREQFAAWLDNSAPVPADTRTRILDSAARVFARKGYLCASLDEVAADAGLTKGAVYWHFSSKNELFFALLDSRFKTEYEQHLPAALEAQQANPDPKAALLELLCEVLGRVEQDPDWPRLFLEFMGQAREPEIRRRLGDAYLSSYRMSAQLIARQHQDHGQGSPDDPELMAIFWSSLMDGLILAWLINPDKIDLKALMPRIVDLLWRGVRPAES
ncbi:TetR/AcrR family transcriptional regulator [Chitinimonas lacunae]|uniref:TetR/AcrR family transcriptional regulator n=1 Tax=Chitinimonas lacunae TaxID=1963018 RepID=A0ABV8MLE8_9NEIS